MSDEAMVHDEVRSEDEVRQTILPPPTLPAALRDDHPGGDGMAPGLARGAGNPEAPDNKKPFRLVRLGRRLCGLR